MHGEPRHPKEAQEMAREEAHRARAEEQRAAEEAQAEAEARQKARAQEEKMHDEGDSPSSAPAQSYTAPEWRTMPPERGIYVLSRPHIDYLVTVSIQHLDNVENREGWMYYGPIPQPEAESAV